MSRTRPKSEAELVSELKAVKGKLNEQKIQIELLTKAVAFWRNKWWSMPKEVREMYRGATNIDPTK